MIQHGFVRVLALLLPAGLVPPASAPPADIPPERLQQHVPDPGDYRERARMQIGQNRREIEKQRAELEEFEQLETELRHLTGELDRAREENDQPRIRQLEPGIEKLWAQIRDADPDIQDMMDLDVRLRERKSQVKRLEDRSEYLQRVLELLETIERPEGVQPVHLSLQEAVRRTLGNNYTVQVVSYNPAIETTRVVEAEAAFDAVFFTNITRENIDRPTGSQLFATRREVFDIASGLRKRLATGAQAGAWYDLRRTKQDFAFQIINPEYMSSLVLELRQPFLRNFGIDVNRSLIVIAKNNRRISDLAFRRQIRDTLREVEEAYWRVVQARRNIVITAREVADIEKIYRWVAKREEHDILSANVATTRAALETARAGFIGESAAVLDAEDRLVALMNDPQINLADDREIIPEDFPQQDQITVDAIAELQTALDHRTEIREQRLRLANAAVAIGQAISAELPRLDVTFRATHDGLAITADRSFDELTRRKFIEYSVGVEFEVPVGNRGPRAARRRAQLQYAQAVAQLKKVLEDVILDVNLAVRKLQTSYDQIGPSFDSMEARREEVKTQVARQERKDYPTLTTELSAWRQLASTRRAVIGAMVEYNIAIADLERAKGTLLEYNSVVIPTEAD